MNHAVSRACSCGTLSGPSLQRLDDAGRQLQAGGALTAFAFQFCGTDMIPTGTRLSGPMLAQNDALLVMQTPRAVQSGDVVVAR